MEKDIDFANTPICQSCGMPLTSPEQFGKNADGTANGDYCVYCCRTAKPTCAAHWMK